MIVGMTTGTDDAHLTTAVPDLNIGKKTTDWFENVNTQVAANEEVDGLGAKDPGKNFSQTITMVEHVKNFTGEIDIEKLAGKKQVGITGVIGVVAVKSGERKGFGAVGENTDGLTEKVVGVAAVVPDIFFDRHLFGDGEIALLHQFVDIEFDGDTGRDAAGGGVGLSQESFFFKDL